MMSHRIQIQRKMIFFKEKIGFRTPLPGSACHCIENFYVHEQHGGGGSRMAAVFPVRCGLHLSITCRRKVTLEFSTTRWVWMVRWAPRALLLLNLSRGVAVEMSCAAVSMIQSDRPDLFSVEFGVLMPQSNPRGVIFLFFLFLLRGYGLPGS